MTSTERARVLVTGTISRADIAEMFRPLAAGCDLTFVEYEREWGEGVDAAVYRGLGELTTWEAHRSANELLDSVRPSRIVLLFTSSLNQVALRAAARARGIETVHVEHGYRLPASDVPSVRPTPTAAGEPRLSGWRTHSFFLRSSFERSPTVVQQLLAYAAAVARSGVTPTVLRRFADLRRPDRYVSYSQECFDYHRDIDVIPPAVDAMTVFTGVPQFDDFEVWASVKPAREAVLIDHQFHNVGWFGWNLDFRREWVQQLGRAVADAGIEQLYVKLHPGDRSNAWDSIIGERIRVVDRDELPELARRVSFVLGSFSTMQMPFVAQPHIATISLEIHPESGRFPSRRFVEAGVSEPVRSFDGLRGLLVRTDALRAQQDPAKSAFTERFLERLDGRAGSRITEAILSPARGPYLHR